jgi:ATP-dependent Clp protease ATP-binding subunit ClpA
MFEHLAPDARDAVGRRAAEEAKALGSPTVEEEHLLLALAAARGSLVGELLAGNGLDHGGLVSALELETHRSLAAVGVSLGDFGLTGLGTSSPRKVRLATSFKRGLERAVRTASGRGDRLITSAHLLVGILAGDLGTVSRALAAADVDRLSLLGAAELLLD